MKNLIFLLAILILSSCENPIKKINLTLVLVNPLSKGKHPAYFKDIVMPIETGCEFNILLKPINVKRLDISNENYETNAWHFENAGENTIEFSRLWLEQYYRDSLVNNYLTVPKKKIPSIDRFIENSNDNILIYSEDASENEYQGIPVLHTATGVNSKIKELACGNNYENITVIINPKEVKGELVDELEPEPETTLTPESNEFKDGLKSSTSFASSWKELYKEAIEHIHPKSFGNDVEHKAGHPEAYAYLVEAAKMAIRLNQKELMSMRLKYDVANKEGLYKIYIGHEVDFNSVRSALSEGNIHKLDDIMNFKLELAEEYSQKRNGNDSDDHDDH